MTHYITIPLSKTGKHAGKYSAIVDVVDADLSSLNWQALITKCTQYATRDVRRQGIRKTFCIHRVILERMIGRSMGIDEEVDHIDHNGLNNRRENLRLATHSQNMQNANGKANNTSGFKGVSVYRKRWKTSIRVNGKYKHLGVFDTPEEAHAAYCAAADKYYGDFSNHG